MLIKVLFVFTLILGIFLRLTNISPFKFYPDAYQSLIVAQNLRTYQSVLGFLGENGMLFPSFFAWSRPGYPILINIANLFINDLTAAATFISFLAGIGSILVVFLLIKNIFSTNEALAAAFLLAISFNHVVWGGFILTDILAILLILLTLYLLTRNIFKISSFGQLDDLIVGVIFSFSIMTRYEYLLWSFPIIFLITYLNPKPFIKLINLFFAFTMTSSLFLLFFYPLNSFISIISQEFKNQIILLVVIFLIFISSKLFLNNLVLVFKKQLNLMLKVMFIFLLLIIFFRFPVSFFALNDFIITDFVLIALALFGLIKLTKQRSPWLYFCLFSLVLLVAVYYQVNSQMQRYMTHLIPSLIIPASFGLVQLLQHNFLIKTFLTFLIIFQIYLSSQGIHQWDFGDWFKKSYEEEAATKVAQLNLDQDSVLLTSFPEAYFFFTQISTQSVLQRDAPPFVSLDHLNPNLQLVIIQDHGMRFLFPNFSKFLDQALQDYKTTEFWVSTNFRYIDKFQQADVPVVIYIIPIAELTTKIAKMN